MGMPGKVCKTWQSFIFLKKKKILVILINIISNFFTSYSNLLILAYSCRES